MIQKKLPRNKSKKLLRRFKIIVDTNIWVSGIFWKGVPGEILKIWRDSVELGNDNLIIVFSKEILEEIWKKLKDFAKKSDENREMLKVWLYLIESRGEFVDPREKITVCRDAKDNKFLEAALACKADFVVSGDRDLLILKEYKGIKIITPKKFLKIYHSKI